MADYIKRSDVVNMVSQFFRESETLSGCPGAHSLLTYAILGIPAADVVPVEEYAILAEKVNTLADKLIKIREIAGCRNG